MDSDAPIPAAPGGASGQRTPSTQQRRNNNRNRKNNRQLDGAVSDGAVIAPSSPRSKKTQHKQRSSIAIGVTDQQTSMGKMNGQRPVSMSAEHMLGTPGKEQAYAGATFQASPAAGALPIPSFFKSRSVPHAGPHPSLQERLAGESTTEEPISSPEAQFSAPAPSRESQQSPLNFLFEADREEKDKIRRESSSLSPASVKRPQPITVPQDPRKHLFLSEMDGDLPSPRTVPRHNRPPPVTRAHSSPGVEVLTEGGANDDDKKTRTETLKKLLFAAVSTPPPQGNDNSRTSSPDEFFGSPSPFQRSGPPTPQPGSDQQNHYSLYYGDRNLSNVFKAVKSETPPRPSSLRQEMPREYDSSSQRHQTPSTTTDANNLARSYLNAQIRSSGPVEMPPLRFSDAPRPLHGSTNMAGPVPIPVQPINAQHRGPDPSVRNMEDNLRRMLKIA